MKIKIINFLEKNAFPFFLFIFSTLFFILQNMLYISWDFSVYELNARFWFSNGNYFEILRPPLTSLLISIFSFFNFYSFGKYAYLFFVSLLYFTVCLKLAEKLKFNKNFFYVLCLNPFVLDKALFFGTELLTLSLLMLFILTYLNNKNGGFFLGLSVLTRYTMLPFSASLLFYKKFKKILLNLIYFSIPVFVWLAYNYFTTGNPLTSIVDSYANNILSRKLISKPADVIHFVYAINITALFLIFYFFKLAKSNFRKLEMKDWKLNIMMLVIAFITVYSYFTTPFKDARYLFNLTLPLAYFSCKALRKPNNKLAYLLGALFLLYSYIFLIFVYPNESILRTDFEEDIAELRELNITNCSIRSDVWPLIAYYGFSANFNKDYLNEKYVENGEYLILFPKYGEYDYKKFNEDLIIKQTGRFVVLGNKSMPCKPASRVYHSFLEGHNESLYLKYNHSVNIDPYYVLFQKNFTLI